MVLLIGLKRLPACSCPSGVHRIGVRWWILPAVCTREHLPARVSTACLCDVPVLQSPDRSRGAALTRSTEVDHVRPARRGDCELHACGSVNRPSRLTSVATMCATRSVCHAWDWPGVGHCQGRTALLTLVCSRAAGQQGSRRPGERGSQSCRAAANRGLQGADGRRRARL